MQNHRKIDEKLESALEVGLVLYLVSMSACDFSYSVVGYRRGLEVR